MARLYLVTLGFDEKFAARFLLRHGLQRGDTVVIVVAGDYEANKKVRAAVDALQAILRGVEVDVRVVPVDPGSAEEAVRRIVEVLSGAGFVSGVYAGLSGGMRALVLVATLALLLYSRMMSTRVDVEVDREDLAGYVWLPLDVAVLGLDERDLEVLRAAQGYEGRPTVRGLAEKLGMSHATVHRVVEKLRGMGLLDEKNRVTRRGRFVLGVLGGSG